ncbi:MAG: hypothetical protein JWP02_384, partial [Acidimicrobiales bacterium]|nr:hypothetical protein [Acidimicrobiales bacterium]
MRTSARLWLAVVTAVALVATGLGVLQAPASAVGIGTSITYASGVFTVAVASSGETVHFSASGTTLSITSDVGTTADAGAQSQGFSSSTGPGVANSGSQTNPTTIQRMFVNGAAGTQTIVFDGGTIGRAIVGANLDIENVSFATAASTFNTAVAGVPALEVTADAVAVNQSVSGNADIVFSADSMTLGAAVNAATVTLQQKGTTSRAVTIGGGATGLGLSDAELGQVAAGVLRIGRTDNPGTLTVDGSVTTHAGYSTLSLRSGGAISQSSTVAVSNLAVTTNGPVGLTNVANAVGTLAASVTGSNQGFGLKSAVTTLTVGTVDGVIGITTNGGAVYPLENNLVAGAL